MSLNQNNYIGTELAWTPYVSRDELPIGKQLVFKTTEGELIFGRVREIQTGTMMIVDGHFDFDMEFKLKGSEWASIEFVFEQD